MSLPETNGMIIASCGQNYRVVVTIASHDRRLKRSCQRISEKTVKQQLKKGNITLLTKKKHLVFATLE